ncbi:hypothetical protein MMC20_000710 [Loxospora ochrophaea]|nr:hypothetical protein [Loxospora ochrophaea]
MLSKQHHPDHNPNDPLAAERFVKISEAYAVLGNTQKRENYDQETRRSANSQAPRAANQGSYSSSSGPFGSRPASGLSKRRTQFRGPPPSFYRSGGWGTESSKRKAQADAAASASADAAAGSASSGATMGGGSSSAGTQINWADWSNDVPHFDREGHFRTQEQQDQRRQRRIQEEAMDYESGGSMFINFVLIGGMVSLACLLPLMFERRHGVKNKEEQ